MNDLEIEIVSEKHDRLYRVVLSISGEDWEPTEIWWIDSPFDALDPQGILVLARSEEDCFYLLTALGGTEVTGHEAYCFYEHLEEELQHAVLEYRQEQNKYDYDPEALVELYGVE